MTVPTWAGFVAYIPDDEIATSQEIAVYGGRNVAAAMCELLAELGCSHITAPDYGGEVGWDFRFRDRGDHSYWCRVQSFHPIYWLLLEGPSGRRGGPAHEELWRKFAGALEQDPRFDQILWRTSKEGPPDWDEFTVTDDLPPPAILEELPHVPARPRPKAAGGPLAPVIIGAWFALAMGVMGLIDHTIRGAKAQSEVRTWSVAALLVGLALVLRLIDRRRKRGLDGSGEDADPGR